MIEVGPVNFLKRIVMNFILLSFNLNMLAFAQASHGPHEFKGIGAELQPGITYRLFPIHYT